MSAVEKSVVEAAAESPSRDSLRSRRHRPVRQSTLNPRRFAKRDIEIGRALYPVEEHADVVRPKTRGECKDGVRPCPFVACKHHLYLDVKKSSGGITINFPDIEPDELEETCSLDVADRDGVTLQEVGKLMNLTRERIRQIEVMGLARLQAETARAEGVADLREEAASRSASKRRLPILGEVDDEVDDQELAAGDFDAEHFASDALDSE